ncbi:DUF7341 domain-containing protein [Nocardia iowensis]|uniref:Uncharacterized protein n=1 Tax=Nocardia iowensis TaxID=204891 RepID=A0ABX8RN15_NOCIO|nr:hypothetical protein [Nocardia iowensis]QXN90302.1 hypothetical protein KV110_33570 [Nocardia iowensis]
MTTTAPRTAVSNELDDAVHALIGHRLRSHTDTDGETRSGYSESVYDEIRAELAARQGGGGTLRPRSLPPAWVEGLDWLTDIDTTVAVWRPDAGHDNGQTETVRRLNLLAAAAWAPEYHGLVGEWIAQLWRWAEAGKGLLEPVHRWELVAACPACEVRTVHRPDAAGELVRQAALQITADGCICQACRTSWAPTHYRLLAAALGCQLPHGVLE